MLSHIPQTNTASIPTTSTTPQTSSIAPTTTPQARRTSSKDKRKQLLDYLAIVLSVNLLHGILFTLVLRRIGLQSEERIEVWSLLLENSQW
jgi:hypothetical protein